jgi:hypothetical protein
MDTIPNTVQCLSFYSTYNVKTDSVCILVVNSDGKLKQYVKERVGRQFLKSLLVLYTDIIRTDLLEPIRTEKYKVHQLSLNFYRFKDGNLASIMTKMLKAIDIQRNFDSDEAKQTYLSKYFLRSNYSKLKTHEEVMGLMKVLIELDSHCDLVLDQGNRYDEYSRTAFTFIK